MDILESGQLQLTHHRLKVSISGPSLPRRLYQVAQTPLKNSSTLFLKGKTRPRRFILVLLLLTWSYVSLAGVCYYIDSLNLKKMMTFLEESVYQPLELGIWDPDYPFEHMAPVELSGMEPRDGDQTCPVLYRLRVTDEQITRFDLHPRDQMLLGTLMARLCHCVCSEHVHLHNGRRALRICRRERDSHFMREALKGAHIVIKGDEGWFYNWLISSNDAHSRISSHHSKETQYGLHEGKYLKTILTGQTETSDSWFQFERSDWDPFQSPLDSIVHALCWIQYKITGWQVGPLGFSRYVDSDPLVVVYDGCTPMPLDDMPHDSL